MDNNNGQIPEVPMDVSPPPRPEVDSKSDRFIYSKSELLRFPMLPECKVRPAGLPDMTLIRGTSMKKDRRRRGGDGVANGDGPPRGETQQRREDDGESRCRRNQHNVDHRHSFGSRWERGQSIIPKSSSKESGHGGRYPKKNTSTLVVAEKTASN